MMLKISKNLTLATDEREGVITIFRAGYRSKKRRRLVMICPGDRKVPQGLIETLGKAANAHLPMVENKRSSPTEPFKGIVKLVSRDEAWYMCVTNVSDIMCRERDTDDLAVWEQVVKLVCQSAVADAPANRSLLKLQVGLL